MKKPLLLLAALAVAAPSFAQTTPPTTTHLPTHRVTRLPSGQPQPQGPRKTPEQRADKHTAMLAKKLSLTADQQAKVHQILLAQAQEGQALKAKYPAQEQRPALHQELKAGHAKYQAQLQSVLSADQYGKLAALRKERHPHGRHDDKAKTKG